MKTPGLLNVKDIDQTTLLILAVKNPNKKEEAALRKPQDILEEMKELDEESENYSKLNFETDMKQGWEIKKLGDVMY